MRHLMRQGVPRSQNVYFLRLLSAGFLLGCSNSLAKRGSEQARKMPLFISLLIVGSVEYTFPGDMQKPPYLTYAERLAWFWYPLPPAPLRFRLF